jgi:hypothetical protein
MHALYSILIFSKINKNKVESDFIYHVEIIILYMIQYDICSLHYFSYRVADQEDNTNPIFNTVN